MTNFSEQQRLQKRTYQREYRKERRRQARARGEKMDSFAVGHYAHQGPNKDDIAARLAEIPEDTRDLTASLMGDPLPGRGCVRRS